MCSVVGCDSWRRSAKRFKLPEDPERRLEWVQFLLKVNGQRLKESSWTDITICSEHLKDDSFENPAPSRSCVVPAEVRVTSEPGAVPSLRIQSRSDRPEPHLEPVENNAGALQHDKLQTSSDTEASRLTSSGAQGSPAPQGISIDTPDAVISVYGKLHPQNVNYNLITEKAELLQKKGNYLVNGNKLLQLFSSKCPQCGHFKVKVEKVASGGLIILNKQCPQCEYSTQWKNQVSTDVPTAVTSETQQAAPTEAVSVDNEESGVKGVSGDDGEMDSDEDWESENETDEETDHEDEESPDHSSPAAMNSQLCTDCGKFFSMLRHHMCEHKMKPFACNICGKRCVSEAALHSHSRIHNEDYEFRCKFCQISFKTKADKFCHEQIHSTEGLPYKCPDCPEAFPTNKARKIHLEVHRGPKQLKCHICGIEFCWQPYLQRHLAVHTGEKPFKCTVCDRGFNQEGHLKSHMRLHTGERPYKCQHCDKRFNHNVSLKSHVQRYHTSNSGGEQAKEKISETRSDTGDAEGNGNNRDADLDLDNTEEELHRPKYKKRRTGRPIGRPKKTDSDSLVLEVQVERQCSKSKTRKERAKKLKRGRHVDEGSETEQTSREKPTNSDTNSDFEKKDKRSGKRRGRRRKTEMCEGEK